ncbi:MAG: FAD-dependent oxidoreductase [Gammaproteobacteria bacterium]|nr:FAD-dependent oxidoreductase [Gammaproteobacteria bacterium]
MRIAVIGGGIAGNVAAYHLASQHQVTLFEAASHLGGHTHTHDIEWQGRHYAVDTGFIVFNDRTYPSFIQLLNELGVGYQPTEMSFSVKCDSGRLEYNGHSLNTLFAQRLNLVRPSFLRMVREILRFNRQAPQALDSDAGEMPLDDYLRLNRYSREFIDHYIVPMGAAIWSTDPTMMGQFPAKFFIRFFVNHGLLNITDRPQWNVIKGGSREYLRPLSAPYAKGIRLNTPVESVTRLPNGVKICSRAHGAELFDAVFIATHSDQALAMLGDATVAEREVLGNLRYQRNEALLHTDTSVMPRRRLAWASWNYHLQEQRAQVALTYDMNRLQGLESEQRFLVTLNNHDAVNPRHILKRLEYDHPIYTLACVAAQARRQDISGIRRTFYCGAYWGNGFHEDGVVSALHALAEFKEVEREQFALPRAG